MATRLTLYALELVATALMLMAAVSAATSYSPIDMAAAGIGAIAAASVRSLSFSITTGRRFDALMASLRAAPPSNDAGGL